MDAPKVPDVLSVPSKGTAEDEFECYEGVGGYFDGTVFEAPRWLGAVAIIIARRDDDGNRDPDLCDRYLYGLDAEAMRATFLYAETVERSSDPSLR